MKTKTILSVALTGALALISAHAQQVPYFAILRLYGPTEAALNKSWKPGDIEKVK